MSRTNPEQPEPMSATSESSDAAAEATERKQAAAAVAGSLGSSIKRKDDGNIDPLASIGGIRGLAESTAVSYTHLTLPTTRLVCRSRWSPSH